MFKQKILKHLSALGQLHLKEGLESLSENEQKLFWHTLQRYDLSLLNAQRDLFLQKKNAPLFLAPLSSYSLAGSKEDFHVGEKLIAQGKMGCLILAGGHGTRLGAAGPKGTVAVSAIKNKTLFQLFFEKTLAASKKAGRCLPLALMTSPFNHVESISYLEQHAWFGLAPETVEVFTQGTLPYLNDQGDWILKAPGVLAEGASGNGEALLDFYHAGLLAKWKKSGIEYVNLVFIDNPLADPFDAELCGFHARVRSEITIKSTPRLDPEEKVGLLAEQNGRLCIVEYTEISEEQKRAKDGQGQLKFGLANTGLCCFNLSWIEKVVKESRCKPPLHLARKKMDEMFIWKIESFIFDLFAYATSINTLVYPRSRCYAPLKNASGDASVETVRAALQESDRHAYFHLTGKEPPQRPFELDQAFYYPTDALRAHWQGKPLPPTDYIDT